jgi:hypothetical protein
MRKNVNSFLVVSKDEFCQKVNTQISIGKKFLSEQITSNETFTNFDNEISKWSDYNKELLKRSFDNPDNEYLEKYILKDRYKSFIGAHYLNQEIERRKTKISKKILVLEKLLNIIDLIPLKGVA